jgi:type II secretory pathway component GspD/PulD (secretin)
LNPVLAAGTSGGGGDDLDTAYADSIWNEVQDAMSELIRVGSTATTTSVQATGVDAGGNLLSGNSVSVAVSTNPLLPPPDGSAAPDNLFAGVSATVVANTTNPVSVTTPGSTDHESPADTGQPWFRITESAGLITVRASPEAHRQIEKYLEEVQAAAHRQVVVEARIVALIRDKTTKRGMDIQGNGQDVTGSALNRLGFFADERTVLDASTATVQGGFFTLASKAGDMALVLQSLATLGDVYTVSTPNLIARNNQISRVAVTRQLGYAETEVNQNTTSTGDIVIGTRTWCWSMGGFMRSAAWWRTTRPSPMSMSRT